MEDLAQQADVSLSQLDLDAWEDLWSRVKAAEQLASDESTQAKQRVK